MRRALLIVPALCSFPLRAEGSGFHVDEQDARATGRAGAVTASTNNASAIYYNPAGLAHLQGVNLEVGVSLVAPTSSFTSADSGLEVDAESNVFALPNAYASYRVSELVAFGIGLTAPFGLALSWPESSPGRTVVREAELRTFFITPTAAFNLSESVPGLAVGAGLDLVPSSVLLERDILFGSDVGTAALSGTAFGVGGRVGVLYRPPALPAWSFGVTYRTPVELSFSGSGDFDAPLPYRSALPPDGDVETTITLPQSVGLGVAFRPVPEWELEVDGNWRAWSSYDTLRLELPAGQTSVSDKDWRDSFTVRVGTEYTLLERWSARLGFIWDETPVPSTTVDFQLPDADRIDVSFGLGAALTPGVQLDASALYVLPQSRDTGSEDPFLPPVKGRFDVDAWVFCVSVGFALGR